MTPDRRAPLRALAERVRAGNGSDDLRDRVLIAFGWKRVENPERVGVWWLSPQGGWYERPPNPLTSIDAAAAAMPEGWTVLRIEQDIGSWQVTLVKKGKMRAVVRSAIAPTLPRAWTAAALEAMAAEGEA